MGTEILLDGQELAVFGCSCGGNRNTKCLIQGRCREPLAWSLEDADVLTQHVCPLFTVLPAEIRGLIWDFALTDCTSQPPNYDYAPKSHGRRTVSDLVLQSSDIAFGLLSTCRAVYLETYTLPSSLNPYIVWLWDTKPWPRKKYLAWQLAHIQSLDVALQQVALEGPAFFQKIVTGQRIWQPKARHEGAYVFPHYRGATSDHSGLRETPDDFSLVSANGLTERLPAGYIVEQSGSRPPINVLYPRTVRVIRARPLIHLTIRVNRTDWWTWTDSPNGMNPLNELGLDPAVGTGQDDEDHRATASTMLHLAEERHSGRFVDGRYLTETEKNLSGRGWGFTIADFPDLRSLELILEAHEEKAVQLEKVISCAKLWAFPINGTQRRLVWDGIVESKQYMKARGSQRDANLSDISGRRPRRYRPEAMPEMFWYDRSDLVEVRVIRFTARRGQ